MAKYTSIGGQALIEGIMMKSPEKTAMAVRLPDGGIDVSYINGKSLRDKYKFFGLPVIRGVVAFVESLAGGYKAMMKSAEISGFADLEEEAENKRTAEANTEAEINADVEAEADAEKEEISPEQKTENAAEQASEKEKTDNSGLWAVVGIIGTVLGVALAVVLFMLVPRLCVSGLQYITKSKFSSVARSATEQIIKLAVLVLYVWAVSFMKDIKRVFMYHGAEHKTIFCYEHGKELTVDNVMRERRFHPRCGTSFMILMILVSFVVSLAVQLIFKGVYDNAILWVCVKILMVPLICGLGFEVLRVCGKYDNLLTRIIAAPGMWLQRITTKEPEPDMVEIAIAAIKACEPAVPDVDRSVDKKDENDEQNDI